MVILGRHAVHREITEANRTVLPPWKDGSNTGVVWFIFWTETFLTAFADAMGMLQHAMSQDNSMYLGSKVEKNPTYRLH